MLPMATKTNEKSYLKFLNSLKKERFSGEIKTDFATRLSVSTDNSVYQMIPQAVLFPKSTDDISLVLKLAQQSHFQELKFSPRGGGTGTNGQSLTSGIVIDCSKYMSEILEINMSEGWVRVQPGVVLDQLNVFLKSKGMQFAPQISPSNRATIGGMINTDACGNGSKILGRTSDHVVELTCVLSNGEIIQTNSKDERDDLLKELIAPHQKTIQEKFIDRPRNLNGYNLLKAYTDKINLNYLFCGSEGTLGIVSECKLKIKPLSKFKKLILVKYKNFDDALRAHEALDIAKPLVVESIDDRLLNLAREDAIYFQIKDMIDGDVKSGGINLVEFVGDNEERLTLAAKEFCEQDKRAIGHYIAKDESEIKLLWDLRKKSVGLISKRQQGTRRPIPFVEDTAVPPEKLADYISEFSQLLDKHGLIYGMYGHVDAGCVHVRPALDLKQAADEKLFRELSDEVVELVKKYGGVMWGEHGMGFRCSYAEEFFGKELYHLVRQIKTLFDPNNRLNPGKIAVPLDSEETLVNLTEPLRAQFDTQISAELQNQFPTVMACNGNGACFNYATQEAMCPSFKVTKNRVQSPKGRATVMREWLRQRGTRSLQFPSMIQNLFRKLANVFNRKDFSHEVYTAMSGCLSCKACASQCPLSVDVPEFKSQFLAQYYQKYFRPLRDYMIAATESFVHIQNRFPKLMNMLLENKLSQWFFKNVVKLVDTPKTTGISLTSELKKRGITPFKLKETTTENAVILLQDAFTTFYETQLVLKHVDFLKGLGLTVYVLPFFPNGKPLHVKGFLKSFSRLAHRNIAYLREVAKSNIPMVGIDPSVTLTYRDEYKKLLGKEALGFEVKLLQEWLSGQTQKFKKVSATETYYLLSHCTEKTAYVAAEKNWQDIFSACGLNLVPLAAGCCGMAGSYGHEAEHLENSKKLFAMDWERYLQEKTPGLVLATGYSCRSQVKRLKEMQLRHPVEVLLEKF